MSDRHDDPLSGGGGGGHDPSGQASNSGWLRGLGVVIVAFVIGALLMPSGTRPPLLVATAAHTTPITRTTTTTSPTTTTTAPVVVPGASAIHVLTANGTTIVGLAGGASTYLRSRGFVTVPATNATTKVTTTQVYAAAGQQGAASAVVNALGLSSNAIQPPNAVAPVGSTGGANVVVVVGSDLSRLAPGSSTTSAGASAH